VAPGVHMNPVLLKPQSEVGSQVIVQGQRVGTARAREFQAWKPRLMEAVLDSYGRLSAEADLMLVEGAGSASEVNLRAGDIANMGFAQAARVPVVLVGDIDRGGVIASLVGTKAVIDPADASLIRGFIVNRFRGDPSLFADGMRMVAERTGWAAIGLVPHFADAGRLPAEDILGLKSGFGSADDGSPIIAVPVMPRIANFDDLDPLKAEPGIEVRLVEAGQPIPAEASLVLLPGSKTTIDDLLFLREQGWDIDIAAHVRRGGQVLGICGGYQMLGRTIADPDGIEGAPRTVPGLGLLAVDTVLTGEKSLVAVTGEAAGAAFAGYEMHLGMTTGPDCERPFATLSDGRSDGAVSQDGRITGSYVHGLFADDGQRRAFLARLGAQTSDLAYEAMVDEVLDRFADHLADHLDIERLWAIAGEAV
jgi:adenosylcobyric acid synthase